jgi:hypothetical protein
MREDEDGAGEWRDYDIDAEFNHSYEERYGELQAIIDEGKNLLHSLQNTNRQA